MKIPESPLIGEFIGYLKDNWGSNSRVIQCQSRLWQLVAMVHGVANAAKGQCTVVRSSSLNRWLQLLRKEELRGQEVIDATTDPSSIIVSTKKLLAGIKTLFVCSAEVDRLTEAAEGLERLTGPSCDLSLFLKVLQLDAMDVDVAQVAATAPYVVEKESYSVSATELPVSDAKWKRVGSFRVGQVGEVDRDVTTSHGQLDCAYQCKRWALASRHHPSFPGSGNGHGQGSAPHWEAEPQAVLFVDVIAVTTYELVLLHTTLNFSCVLL